MKRLDDGLQITALLLTGLSVGISCWLPAWPGMKLSRTACMWSGPGDTDPWLVVPGVAAGSHVAVHELLHSSGRSLDDVQIVPHLFPSP